MKSLKKLFKKEESPKQESISDFKNKIYPWIKVIEFENSEPADFIIEHEDFPIHTKWLGDLSICYVADRGEDFLVISENILNGEFSKEELHQIAVSNLENDITYELAQSEFGAYGLLGSADHIAGSITLPGVWIWLVEHFNENLIVSIPAKDLVFLVPESDLDTINNMKIFLYDFLKTAERPLSKHLYKFDVQDRNWTLYE